MNFESNNFCPICGNPNCEDIECYQARLAEEEIDEDYKKLMNDLFDEII